ncbi:MAG: AMP-binding protein, partial [Hyphomicrobiales bacterium]
MASVVFRRMLPQSRSYEELYRQFRWRVPAQFNIGVEVCDRWAAEDPDKLALIAVSQDGQSQDVSYGWLRETSNRLANALTAHGIQRGDRVAILLPQTHEVAAIHIAIYKLGGIALPLAVLFGSDALAYRLHNAGAKALLTNEQGLAKIAEIRRARGDALAGLELILSVDGPGDGALGMPETLARASSDFTPLDTAADDPAMMIYTSGTTGQPKGALHAHRVL